MGLVEVVALISIHAPLRGRPNKVAFVDKAEKFQSTPPCGGDCTKPVKPASLTRFQSTPPCGGDSAGFPCRIILANFNPRPLAGATGYVATEEGKRIFQSTPPCGGDSWIGRTCFRLSRFQSTPPCGGDPKIVQQEIKAPISIHAPLRGRPGGGRQRQNHGAISIHAPLRGRRMANKILPCGAEFQSTPPCGGDEGKRSVGINVNNFNPRPLAGATNDDSRYFNKRTISIHAPLRGRQQKQRSCDS